jgi:hypothetical protein
MGRVPVASCPDLLQADFVEGSMPELGRKLPDLLLQPAIEVALAIPGGQTPSCSCSSS